MPLVITQERNRLDLNLPKIRQGKQSVPKKTGTEQVKRFAPEKNQFLTGPTENKFELSRADKYMYTRGSAAYWADKCLWAGPSGRKKMPPKSQKHKKGVS